MIVIIQRLKDYSEIKLIGIITAISIIVTIIIFFLMRSIELELISQTAYGVIDLEFAWNVDQMDQILATWGDELIAKEILAVVLDFGFLFVYSLSLAGITLLLTKSGVFGFWTNLGYYFTLLPFLAAIFDLVENITLILVLTSPSSFPPFAPFIASICATIKFSLIILTVFFWIAGFIFSLIQRIFDKRKTSVLP